MRLNNNRQTPATVTQQNVLFSELGLKQKETITFNQPGPSAVGTSQDVSFTTFSFDGRKDLKTVLKQLNDQPSILYAEPDYILKPTIQPNDERFSELWGLDNQGQDGGLVDVDIDAPEAWDNITDSSSIVVGVIDTGVDYLHEDLVNNMWINPGEIPNDGLDNDANGYIDDIHGIDCANNDSDPIEDENDSQFIFYNHGTHVAGTIGAEGDNGIGVAGINWKVKIMALKYYDPDPAIIGSNSDTLECLAYAVNMKNRGINIQITNNSYGGPGFSQVMNDAIQASADAKMLFVAAAGNNANDNDVIEFYPANYDIDNIVSVAATTRIDELASFSNFGENTVDLAAPGTDIISTIPGNQYGSNSGTSMAAPHVSGAAAFLWSYNPSLSAIEVKNKLITQGDPILSLSGGITGSGRRLNIGNALNCLPGSPVFEIFTPENSFFFLTETEVVVRAKVTDCGISVTNLEIQAIPDNGDSSIQLIDDGQGADDTANDGIYTGIWGIQNPGEQVQLLANVESLGLADSISGIVFKDTYRMDPDHIFDWIDATSGSRLNLSDLDDEIETLAIGFNFEFYGITYSEVHIDSNGYLTFESNFSNLTNLPIPDNTEPNGFIAPYWDDINPSGSTTGNIYSLTEGTAPNRRFTVAWVDTPLFDGNASDGPLTFELTLYEGSNDIIFQYGNSYSAESSTIGIEHQSGNAGLQYLHNGENEGTPVQIQNEQAIRFFVDQDEGEPPGEKFIFSSLLNDQEVYSDGNLKWVGQSSARVGGATGTQDGAMIMVFQLPELAVGESITATSLEVELLAIANNPQGHVDLYGLGFRNSPTVLASDFYQGPFGDDLSGVRGIQDDFATLSSAVGTLTPDTNGKVNLAAYVNAQYAAGATGGDYIFIRLNPDETDVSSFNYWEFATANSDNAHVLTLTKPMF